MLPSSQGKARRGPCRSHTIPGVQVPPASYQGWKPGPRRPEEASRPPCGGDGAGSLSAPHSPRWSRGLGGRRVGARAACSRAAGVGRQPGAHPPHPAAPPPRHKRRTRKLPRPRTDFRANRADALTFSGGSDIIRSCGGRVALFKEVGGWTAAVRSRLWGCGGGLGRTPWNLGFPRAVQGSAGTWRNIHGAGWGGRPEVPSRRS